MSELLISVNDGTAQRLQELAASMGLSPEQEASNLLEGAVKRADQIRAFLADADAFAASLPPQVSDSADLIREDRDCR